MKRKLYYNGRILTMDDGFPYADYVLTEGERIVKTGGADELPSLLAQDMEKVDLQGRLMLPGFIDSHLHMLTAALNRLKLDISGMRFPSAAAMLDYVKQQKAGSDEPWISVFGFSEENMGDGRMVDRWDIDRVFPDIPVTVIRVCGHMSIVNTKAIEQLDEAKMASISGGAFEKDGDGQYNGLATEAAQQYVLDSMPVAEDEVILSYLAQEQTILMQKGITSIHDAGTDMMLPREYIRIYEEFARRGELKIRTYLMARPEENEPWERFDAYLRACRARHCDDAMLQIGSVKLFADGSLGSRTAAVKEPYDAQPDNRGLLLNERLDAYVQPLVKAGHQIAVHAIGDRATEYVLQHYCAVEPHAALRLRIEHAEVLDEALLNRIAAEKILIMTQPIFIREFGNTYFRNLGEERAMHIQPLRTMLDKGICVGFGTDYPVDDPDPLLGIHAAMTRRIKDSDRLLNEQEAISFEEAVRCYTRFNACGAFSEAVVGSIEQGKYADFVILSGITPDADGVIRCLDGGVVDATVIGGETVFERDA